MRIAFKGALKVITGSETRILDLPGSVGIEELKTLVGIDKHIPVIACAQGQRLPEGYQFRDSDKITLFPLVAGG